MDKRSCFLLSLLFIIALISCSNTTNYIEHEPADIIGIISKFEQTQDSKKILVEEDSTIKFPEEGGDNKKIMFSIQDTTKIYKQDGNSLSTAPIDSLTVGNKIKGWTGNIIQTSYPIQAPAKQIVLIRTQN